MGIFANQPDVLQLFDSDIIQHPALASRHPISNRHQIVIYVYVIVIATIQQIVFVIYL